MHDIALALAFAIRAFVYVACAIAAVGVVVALFAVITIWWEGKPPRR